jgi:hypothetical protein
LADDGTRAAGRSGGGIGVLLGVAPNDPLQQATTSAFVQALGFAVPPNLLVIADEAIE